MKKSATPLPGLRLDKWLWFARVTRSRSGASRLCLAGCVTLGTQIAKPHHPVRVGDSITVQLQHQRRSFVVRALGTRRGPPSEARLLYDEPTPPATPENLVPAWTSLFAEGEEACEDQRLTQSL